MKHPLLAFVLLALLAVPASLVGLPERGHEPLRIEVTPLRVGDVLRYDVRVSIETPEENVTDFETQTIAVENKTSLPDRYGYVREVESFLWQVTHEETLAVERCHRLAGGNEAVQREVLAEGAPDDEWWLVDETIRIWISFDRPKAPEGEPPLTLGPGRCLLPTGFTRLESFMEGARYSIEDLAEGVVGPSLAAVLSKPAMEDRFQGRRALRLDFSAGDVLAGLGMADAVAVEGIYSFLVAEGLPGFASTVSEIRPAREGALGRSIFQIRLEGWDPGQGPPLAPWANATLPAQHPKAEYRASSRLGFEHAAFELPYPFSDALAALRADPRLELDRFLASHPEALLVGATYDRFGTFPVQEGARVPWSSTDGAWTMVFLSGGITHTATTARLSPMSGILPQTAGHGALHQNSESIEFRDEGEAYSLPPVLVDGPTLAQVADLAGLPIENLARLQYKVSPSIGGNSAVTLTLSDAPAQGRRLLLRFDLATGGLQSIAGIETLTPEDLLLYYPASLSQDRAPPETFSLAIPSVGAGLSAGHAAAATSIALAVVFLLVKFVALPLYHRLARAHMLDHPLRAELVRLAQETPGVRLAEIVQASPAAASTVRRHLALLVKHRFLVELRDGPALHYYVPGEVPLEVARRLALLRRPGTRALHDLLAKEPDLSLREAAARLGVSAPTVLRHRRMLEKAGLIRRPDERPPAGPQQPP